MPSTPHTPAPLRPLRVVHVTWGLDVGGQEKVLVELARHARPWGQELLFVSLGCRGVLAEEVERCGWPVTALGAGPGLWPGLLPRLAALFRGRRADVVHTHDPRALVYGGPAARLARVPLLVHTWHGQGVGASAREPLLFRLAGRLADRVVTVSDDAAAAVVARGIPAARVRTLRNGIDLARFAYAGPRPGGPAVTVARLSPEKDLATLLRAAALVGRRRPDFRLEIAGDGACLPDLRRLAGDLGLDGRARFLGRVADVPAVLTGAGLFVLSSKTEGISLALLEAMARGLPVVATRVGGNPEVVADGETGLLVPPACPEELAAAVLRLAEDPEAARRMGEAGRRRVERLFDVRGMAAAYDALYRGRPAPAPERRPAVAGLGA